MRNEDVRRHLSEILQVFSSHSPAAISDSVLNSIRKTPSPTLCVSIEASHVR